MNKKISLGAAISFMAVVAAITFTITMIFSLNIFNDKVYNVKEREELYKKVSEIDHLIRQNYVGELDEQTLLDSLSGGFVTGSGDPYARYYDAATFSRLQAIENGELVGIGADLSRDDSGYIHINKVYAGSPAESAGLLDGDLIISIGEQDVKAITYDKARDLLIDVPGSRVTITYRRESVDNTCEVVRKTFEVPVVSVEILDDGNAYVKIASFSDAAVKQFQTVVNKLVAENVTGVVFDLRNTNQGSLENACEMLNLVVPTGELLSVTYKDGTTNLLKRSDTNELNLPMVTLVNSKTQYAAELFAANLLDYEKSKLVGTKTYGQGVMQETYQLKDGSGVVLSSAFFSPAISDNFNGVGLIPDYETTLSTEAEKNLSYGKLSKEEDSQLSKALEVLSVAK